MHVKSFLSPNVEIFTTIQHLSESAMISAGFYRANGDLVYKLLVNCAEQTWSTLYKLPKQRGQVWKTGALADPCKKGRYVHKIIYQIIDQYSDSISILIYYYPR